MSFTIVEQCTAAAEPLRAGRARLEPADVREGGGVGGRRDLPRPRGRGGPGPEGAGAGKNIIQAVNDIDWGTKTLSVRINGLDTHYMYRDVVDVLEQAGDRLDLIMIPKVGTAADVYAVDMLVTQVEAAKGRKKRIGFELIIETALGMANVDEIAKASQAQRIAAFRRRRLRRQHARPHHR